MRTLWQDLRYGLRMLAKRPGFTAVAVLTLGLGIGANTAIFSSINSMLLRPIAARNLGRLYLLWETAPRQNQDHISASPANFLDWSEQARDFQELAALHGWDVNLSTTGVAERVEGYRVTAGFFSIFGIPARLGRSIGAGDFQPGHESVVVLSNGFWQRHLAGDRGVIGKTLLMNGQKFTVIGVMPDEFDYPVGAEAWAPLVFSPAERADRAGHYLQVLGLLKPHTPVSQAQAELSGIASRLAREYPEANSGHGVRVVGLVEDLTNGSRQFLTVLMGAAIFVLLLACANVANLQLARATARSKEIAVRRALGAKSRRIAGQLLVESVLLALLGGLAGLVLASWGVPALRQSIPAFIVQHIAGLKHFTVDFRVFGFTLFIAAAAGIVAGLAPAWEASRGDFNDALKEGARGGTSSSAHSRLRGLLVVAEVALAFILLVGAGLMVEGFRNLLRAYPGFERNHVLTFRVSLSELNYRDPGRVRGFYDRVLRNLQALPGVESAAVVTSLPSSWSWNQTEYQGETQPPAAPGELRTAVSQIISPDFFTTLRVPLLTGRLLTAQDGPGAPPVAVLSETLARRIWPDRNAVGSRIRLGGPGSREPWRTIVGVVRDIRQSSFDKSPHPTVYVPFAQMPQASSSFVVRTAGNPVDLAAAARKEVLSVDPNEPPYDLRTMAQLISDDLSGVESSANMMIVFGVIALLLAAAGIFALMAYSVSRRTHEIGVRLALGARPADIFRLVVGRALKLAVIGLLVGIPCSLALTGVLSSFLFGVVRIDLVVLIGLALLLGLVAALAAYVPARRATKVDPMVALRYE
jgi:putative ABC transport system permease protein